MVKSFWRRLAPGALVLGLALAGLAATQSEGVAQSSSCGNGSGPLCKEVMTCRPTGPYETSCGTSYTYYNIQIT
jgi:hypothetical protein